MRQARDRRDQRRRDHRRVRACAGLRRADRVHQCALCRYACAGRHHARLGPVAEAVADDRHLARQGAVTHRQFPRRRHRRALGAGQSRGRPRGIAPRRHRAGARHGEHRSRHARQLQAADRRWLCAELRAGPGAGGRAVECRQWSGRAGGGRTGAAGGNGARPQPGLSAS